MTTDTDSRGNVARITVAVTAPRLSRRTLELAASIARRMHAELEALFVEESDLFGIADLPVTRETELASGIIRELDSARLARAMRAEAGNLRHELARLSAAGTPTAALRVVRGRYAAAAIEAAAHADVAIVHRASRIAPDRMRRPVWAAFDGSPGSRRAIGVAAVIAAELGTTLVALVSPTAGNDVSARAAEARALAGAAADTLLTRTAPEGGPAMLAGAATTGGARALVMARDTTGSNGVEWLGTLAIPVVLVA